MKFNHKQPFLTPKGDVITMKALLTIYGVVYVATYKDDKPYCPATLTPMRKKEYEAYLIEKMNQHLCCCTLSRYQSIQS